MQTPFVDFIPAEYHECKSGGYVAYYILDPADMKMHRKQIRLNRIKTKSERKRYAAHLCHVINERLYNGWNPYKDYGGIKGLTIEEGIALFLKEKTKSSRNATLVSYNSLCNILLGWLKVNGMEQTEVHRITEKMLTDYMDWVDCERKPTNRTFNNYVVFLHTLFGFFADRKLLKDSPVPKLGKRKVDTKRRVVIPSDVRARIKDYYLERCAPFYTLMLLCYKCLIRPKEILGLKIGDIDWTNHTVTVRAEIAKNHKERVIALPEDVMSYFLTIAKCPRSYYIFTNKNKFIPGLRQMPHQRVSDNWAKMREELGLPMEYQFYSLKDTGITEMLDAGVPAKYVKELADHSSLEITEKYIHKTQRDEVLKCTMLHF